MPKKVACLLIHGIGKQKENYADSITFELKKQFAYSIKGQSKNPEKELIIEPVLWSNVFQNAEDELWEKLKKGGSLDYRNLRRLMIDFAADAIAYVKIPNDSYAYDSVHSIFAKSLHKLSRMAGEKAPLSIIAHSLGTVIASNFIYDYQASEQKPYLIPEAVKKESSDTPLERLETLVSFYTLGSPIPIWALRYNKPKFGMPVTIPSPKIKDYYPDLKGEWINYYDRDDIIGFPLKTINEEYNKAVTADREINVGDIFSSWNPAAHLGYWSDSNVIIPIAESLANIWLKINS